MTNDAYALGDSGERLEVVARFFEPEMTWFIRDAAPANPGIALDLGCGPGHTTRLLHDVTGAATTVGVDVSEHFLRLAAADAPPALRFVLHDLAAGPPPVEPADVVFCHLLLSHLPDPAQALESWAGLLTPGGVLLVDEVEAIHTEDPVLVEYLSLVEAAIDSRGGVLHIGPQLAAMAVPSGLCVRSNRAVAHPAAATDAAALFSLTLRTLRDDPAVQAAASRAELAALADALDARTRLDGQSPVVWSMRHIVYAPSDRRMSHS